MTEQEKQEKSESIVGIVPAAPQAGVAIRTMDELGHLARVLANSAYFSDITSTAQAGVKVLAGIELGFPPMAAMTGIHIVKGRIQIGANLIAAAIKRSPRYRYTVATDENGKRRFNNEECALVFWEKVNGEWEEMGDSVFTIEDAKAAGTQNISKFPRNMLFARAISNGARWYCPDIFLGVSAYTEGEIEEAEGEGIPVIPQEDLDGIDDAVFTEVHEQTTTGTAEDPEPF